MQYNVLYFPLIYERINCFLLRSSVVTSFTEFEGGAADRRDVLVFLGRRITCIISPVRVLLSVFLMSLERTSEGPFFPGPRRASL
jgi:hypothetical protein